VPTRRLFGKLDKHFAREISRNNDFLPNNRTRRKMIMEKNHDQSYRFRIQTRTTFFAVEVMLLIIELETYNIETLFIRR